MSDGHSRAETKDGYLSVFVSHDVRLLSHHLGPLLLFDNGQSGETDKVESQSASEKWSGHALQRVVPDFRPTTLAHLIRPCASARGS
jgi:hypothetical protein